MDTFEEFERCLREALAHLYDPAYQAPEILWTVTGCSPQQGVEAIQAALIRAIEGLRPATNVPHTARIRRIYELLFCRYVQDLTQEEAAERLGITPRHLRREQQEAVHVLAQRLWGRSRGEAPSAEDLAQDTWRSQVRQELASLQKSAPGTVTDVGEAIHHTLQLGSALTLGHDISLNVELVHPNLVTAIHPSALRQVLIAAIGKLVQHMPSGRITLRAEGETDRVKITIAGYPATVDRPPDSNLIQEILAAQGGSVKVGTDDNGISFWVELPAADTITVVVVDDNVDLVHFYRRYTTGTKYQIVHVAEGQQVFEAINDSAPDIIVLDVMLPDTDGWELLTHLREDPVTRLIPVIVCSVVRERELALALGATLYLPKPVRRRPFVQALDRALSQASTRAPISPVSNAATC